jgi:hypothetical protein
MVELRTAVPLEFSSNLQGSARVEKWQVSDAVDVATLKLNCRTLKRKTMCKVWGMTLNYIAVQINFDSIRDLALEAYARDVNLSHRRNKMRNCEAVL